MFMTGSQEVVGSNPIFSKGGPVNAAAPTNGIAVLGDLNNMLANYGMSVSPSGMPTDTIAMQVINDPEECDQYYGNDVIEKNRCLCDNFPDVAPQSVATEFSIMVLIHL